MSLKIGDMSTGGEAFTRVGEGTFPARIVRILDLGLQVQTEWPSNDVKKNADGSDMVKPEIWLDFELPDELMDYQGEQRPRWIGKTYLASMSEMSNLYKVIKALKPKAESLEELLDVPCLITVGSTSGDKDKITGVSAVPKGMTVGKLANPKVLFDISSPDEEVLDTLPSFLKEKVLSSESYGGNKEV